jgi:cytochrome c biogenesis protein CcmG, thiol:disulfide interchange protein DsbE
MRVISLLCLFFAASIFIYPQDHQKKIQNVKVEDLDGNKVELKKYFGKAPVLISFWATWCKPCQEELDEYQKLYNEYKAKGFQMLAVSIDNKKTAGKVKPYIKSRNYNFTVLIDSNSEAANEFNIQDVPNTFLLDKKGNIVFSRHGYKKGDELEFKNNIKKLIK